MHFLISGLILTFGTLIGFIAGIIGWSVILKCLKVNDHSTYAPSEYDIWLLTLSCLTGSLAFGTSCYYIGYNA